MFTEVLKDELKTIFGVKKVVIAALAFGAEQEIIYCEITKVRNDIKDGYEYAEVSGSVAMVAAEDKLKRGYMHKQIARMSKELNKKFFFDPNEREIPFPSFDKVLSRYSVDFTYFYVGEYDPKKPMQGVNYKEV